MKFVIAISLLFGMIVGDEQAKTAQIEEPTECVKIVRCGDW